MVFVYVPATGTAGINTQLFFFAPFQSLFFTNVEGSSFYDSESCKWRIEEM